MLIYAAVPGHELGRRVLGILPGAPVTGKGPFGGIGSTLLLPEVLAKPMREGRSEEVAALAAILARLDLRPADEAVARLATGLAASYRLRPMDALHLATAVAGGADRFVTNNRRDLP